jgi:hypothetical protein
LYLALPFLLAATLAAQVRSQVIQGDEREVFLRQAKIVKADDIPIGVASPRKLSLELNGSSGFSAFKSIDVFRQVMKFDDGGTEFNFQDTWKTEVAAYEVDKLIGLGMVPATIERTFDGRRGSAQFWVNVLMPEAARVEKKIEAPDSARWNDMMLKVRLFDNLIYNMDRNLNNLLITPEWELVMIDHSRSFRPWDRLKSPEGLTRFSKSVLEGIQRLSKANLKEKAGRYISDNQIEALLKRRDLILDLSKKLAAERGEARVLYP